MAETIATMMGVGEEGQKGKWIGEPKGQEFGKIEPKLYNLTDQGPNN